MSAQEMLPGLPGIPTDRPVYLSHSAATLYQVEPWQYKVRYVERLEPVATAVNLAFGKAFDEGSCAFLVAHALGQTLDPWPIFERSFNAQADANVVQYSTKLDSRETCLAIGKRMLEVLVERWLDLGWVAALGPDGVPLVQLDLRVHLPDNIIYTSVLDVVALTPDAALLCVDIKTAAQASFPAFHAFHALSEQLTGQQMALEAHKARFGIEHVDGVGFFEVLKKAIPKTSRGTGPQALVPDIVEPRSKAVVDDYIQSLRWIAEDIRRGRFPKRPLNAYNSPYQMSDFTHYSLTGSKEGLRVRKKRKAASDPQQTRIEETV